MVNPGLGCPDVANPHTLSAMWQRTTIVTATRKKGRDILADEKNKPVNFEDEEPEELTLAELKGMNLSDILEGQVFLILESNFPETNLWRDQNLVIAEITEHIYSKYWWHKYHARVFADAMIRAIKRLENEGHPISDANIESDEDIHIFVRWLVKIPVTSSAETVINTINSAFDLVWERANAILENSDSVLLLGKDAGEGLQSLKNISTILEEMGYYTYIIKEQPDKIGESVIQKVLRFALSSRFIIVENTESSGHLYEIPHVTKMAESITIILQEEGHGATWMFEDAYKKHNHWKKFEYKQDNLQPIIFGAVKWAEDFINQFGQYQKENLPWLK